jgi:hypothetical protein
MRRNLWIGSVLLAATVAATVAAPRAMVSPGELLEGHRDVEGDCFACHTPFRGPDARCVACHALDEIDKERTKRLPFHAALAEPECSACHTEHHGRSAGRSVREFRHALVRADVRRGCGACHDAPDDDLHRDVAECAPCHEAGSWASTFDHAPLFRFDRDHPPDCRTCHVETFEEVTCYGCHEHERREMEEEHREEGILDITDCAKCHRSADEHEAEGGRRRRGRRR